MRNKWIGISAFTLVLLLCGMGSPFKIWAQATAGFTKVNTSPITTTSFTSGTLVNGATYIVEITSVDSAGESLPSTTVSGTVPASGTHTFTISWSAPTTGSAPSSYNVYDMVVTIPNPPVAPSLTIN